MTRQGFQEGFQKRILRFLLGLALLALSGVAFIGIFDSASALSFTAADDLPSSYPTPAAYLRPADEPEGNPPTTGVSFETDPVKYKNILESIEQSARRWLKQRKQEAQTLSVDLKIKQLETESEKIIEDQYEQLQGQAGRIGKSSELKRHVYPMGEWNPEASENTLSVPDLNRLHRYRIEYHKTRIAVLRILEEALDSIGFDGVNLIFENAEIPPVEELVENPAKLQEYSKFVIEVLEQLGFRFGRPQ